MIDVGQLKAGITISDVLDNFDVKHHGNRCVCPIHQGARNPTSFCFSDDLYYCHSCGAKGDVISLLQHLTSADFKTVVEYLAGKRGIDPVPPGDQSGIRPATSRYRRKPLRLLNLEADYELCREKIGIFTRRLQRLREERRSGRIDLGDFYLQEQKLDYWLDHLDTEATQLHCKIRKLKEELL